jgi:hypothetical protein
MSFEYVGLDPTLPRAPGAKYNAPTFDLAHAEAVEQQLSIKPFTRFPYGCATASMSTQKRKIDPADKEMGSHRKAESAGDEVEELQVLRRKRDERNPFRRTTPYHRACPEIRELLDWCETTVYSKPLPWAN